MKELTTYFEDKNVQTVLDVGTGSGDFIKVLKKAFPGSNITGVDPNSDSLKEALILYPDVKFVEMVAENLTYTDNSFDIVSISMALHHLPDIEKSLSEIKRVVKPDGWIIISELFSDNLNNAQKAHKIYHHFRSKVDRMLGVCHNETFKKNEILQLLKDSGIQIQHYFEFKQDISLINNEDDLIERVDKMKGMLEMVKTFPDYNLLKQEVDLFKKEAKLYGFQPATKVVIIGKKS